MYTPVVGVAVGGWMDGDTSNAIIYLFSVSVAEFTYNAIGCTYVLYEGYVVLLGLGVCTDNRMEVIANIR